MTAAGERPLHTIQVAAGASFIPYGPAEHGVQIVETFGNYEAEYATVRKGVGILETPQRGLIEVTGADRLDFLHRLLTADLQALAPDRWRPAFMLSRQGRIEADVSVLAFDDRVVLVLDRFNVQTVLTELGKYLFADDVNLSDGSDAYIYLALHGPATIDLIAKAAGSKNDDVSVEAGHHKTLHIGGHEVTAYRRDETGSLGLSLIAPRSGSEDVYETLANAVGGLDPFVEGGLKRDVTGRGIGWLAYNTLRIEAGTAIYHIDFGPDSLPHETGLLDATVSFTKGCYPGQEVVARMHNLGHAAKVLVGLRFDDDRLPVAGTQVMGPQGDPNDVVGAITSSTLSPMLGNVAIALAMMKWGMHEEGTPLKIHAEGEIIPARVEKLVVGKTGD